MGRPQFYQAVEGAAQAAARNAGDEFDRVTKNVASGSTGGETISLDGTDEPAEKRTYTSLSVAYRDGNVPSDAKAVTLIVSWYAGTESGGPATEARRTIILNPGPNCAEILDPPVEVDEYDEISVDVDNNDANAIEISVNLSYYTEAGT